MDDQKVYRALLQYVQQIGLNEKDSKVKMKLVHSQRVSKLSQKLGNTMIRFQN